MSTTCVGFLERAECDVETLMTFFCRMTDNVNLGFGRRMVTTFLGFACTGTFFGWAVTFFFANFFL